MKKDKQTIAKYTRLYAIGLWGILSIIWLSGEPIDDMALGKFCVLKGIGLASLGLCCRVGKRLDTAGLLPDMDDENDCEI